MRWQDWGIEKIARGILFLFAVFLMAFGTCKGVYGQSDTIAIQSPDSYHIQFDGFNVVNTIWLYEWNDSLASRVDTSYVGLFIDTIKYHVDGLESFTWVQTQCSEHFGSFTFCATPNGYVNRLGYYLAPYVVYDLTISVEIIGDLPKDYYLKPTSGTIRTQVPRL